MRITTTIGPFASVYVAMATSNVWTEIKDLRTDGVQVTESIPTDYLPLLDNDVQADYHSVKASLTWLSDSDQLTLLSRGQDLSANVNDPPGMNKYRLVLLHSNPNITSSFYISDMTTAKQRTVNYLKSDPSKLNVVFEVRKRDTGVLVIYKGTSAAIKTLAGI